MKTASNKKSYGFVSVVLGCALAWSTLGGCNKSEAPPPLPAPKAVATPTAVKLALPVDAGGAPPATVKKVGGGGMKAPGGGLAACCAALRQNAENAPPETKGHMLTAAAACQAADGAGTAKGGFMLTLGGLLKGAGMPAACQ